MVRFLFRTNKQFNSAAKNSREMLIRDEAEMERKSFRQLLEKYDKRRAVKYNESNFKKLKDKNRIYSKKQVKADIKVISKGQKRELKKDWKEAKKAGVTDVSFTDFVKANTEEDFEAMKEMFNSPN